MKIMDLLKKNIRPRDIANACGFQERHRVDMALAALRTPCFTCRPSPRGGHPALTLTCSTRSARRPNLCKLSPAGAHHIEDLDAAGGVQAVMKEIS